MDKRLKNHIGEKYGALTVIERSDKKSGCHYMWKCQCDCGNITYGTIYNMAAGRKVSCGCRHTNDLTGKKFGRLTVVERYEKMSSGHSKWLCICECGNTKIVEDSNLKHSDKISCGCWRKELYIENAKYNGDSKTELYKIWSGMIRRCYNQKMQNYKYYGGRGVCVCDDWRNDENGYFNFKKWALENGYKEGLSIERVDYNGNYCPENCTWILQKDQMKNTRRTHKITYNGKTMCLTDWAKELNISRWTLSSRLQRGMSVEEAFTSPVK